MITDDMVNEVVRQLWPQYLKWRRDNLAKVKKRIRLEMESIERFRDHGGLENIKVLS